MVNIANTDAYTTKFDKLTKTMSREDAVKYHVGGIENYFRVGATEAKILDRFGLTDGAYLIDLGCGSGRLAGAINRDIRYLGIDVVDELLNYSREKYPQYRFVTVSDFIIPEDDGAADIVCAFSLFTHLLHEQTFLYMKEAVRVLKRGGRLVSSFLEYPNSGHRRLFLQAVGNVKTERPLIVFNARESLRFFAAECGFDPRIEFIDADEQIADFGTGEILANGEKLSGTRSLGQSLCVLTK